MTSANRATDVPVHTHKFEFTGLEKTNLDGVAVKQIRALVDIPSQYVKAGDVGGWIESAELANGDARVADNAWVHGDAQVYGSARLHDNAQLDAIGSQPHQRHPVAGDAAAQSKLVARVLLTVDVHVDTDPGIDTPHAYEPGYDYLAVRAADVSLLTLHTETQSLELARYGLEDIDPDELVLDALRDALISQTQP